jgi:hypothetical protein
VLWLGDPEALPLDGWQLDEGLAYATSRNGAPTATDLLPGSASSATRTIARSIQLAERGDTSRLGRLLAPMAVRYIVVPVELATGLGRATLPVPPQLHRALVSQIDLRLLPSDPAVAIYENTSWGPGREVVPSRLTGPIPEQLGSGTDLSGATPVLPGRGPVHFTGDLPLDGTVLVAEAPSPRWRLTVGGQQATRQGAYGVANAYRPASTGHAALRFRTPLVRYGAIAFQLALWFFAVRTLIALRRRAARVEALDRR